LLIKLGSRKISFLGKGSCFFQNLNKPRANKILILATIPRKVSSF